MNWLQNVKALELEARTYDEYENIIEKRTGNHNIGSRQLQSITSDTWQAFVNELSGKYALGTIKKTWYVIKQIVTYAEAKGDIRESTLKLVRLPKESNVAVKAKEIALINNGLIPLEELTVSGDGTAVRAYADPFGRNPWYLKSLPEGTCTDNLRHYSDPDAPWGWDSHEKHWYFVRTLYMLVCRNPELSLEVPPVVKSHQCKTA